MKRTLINRSSCPHLGEYRVPLLASPSARVQPFDPVKPIIVTHLRFAPSLTLSMTCLECLSKGARSEDATFVSHEEIEEHAKLHSLLGPR